MDALAKVSVADALKYVVAPLVALRVLHTLYASLRERVRHKLQQFWGNA